MRILVTNDDGIDSLGLHALARAVADLGDVTLVAPATEYSGAGASLGTLNSESPIARKHEILSTPPPALLPPEIDDALRAAFQIRLDRNTGKVG